MSQNPEQQLNTDEEEVEYADNFVSRALYGASKTLLPNWCQTPEHWTVRIMDYLWTDCACCLFYRGVVLGACLGGIGGVILGAALTFIM